MELGATLTWLKTDLTEKKNQTFSAGSGLLCHHNVELRPRCHHTPSEQEPGGFSQPSSPGPDTKNEDCSTKMHETFMLKWPYKLMDIWSWKEHSYHWRGSDLSKHHPSKSSIKGQQSLQSSTTSHQWDCSWIPKAGTLSKEFLGVSKYLAQNLPQMPSPQAWLFAHHKSPMLHTSIWQEYELLIEYIWLLSVTRFLSRKTSGQISPTNASTQAALTQASRVFISQGRKSTLDDPASPPFVPVLTK